MVNLNFSEKSQKEYLEFSRHSFSWEYIEKPSFDKHVKPIVNNKTKILDIGCGEGRSTELFLSYGATPENIVGVDSGKILINAALEKHPHIKFINSDISLQNFPSDSFDLICSNMVFYYLSLDNMKSLFRNSYNWLKKGGTIFFVVSHPSWVKSDNYFERKEVITQCPWGHIKFYSRTFSDYVNNLIDSGFEIKTLDEPEVSPKAAKKDPKWYEIYKNSPSRLAIKAIKP